MTSRTREEDDARADDFRCLGCEAPLPVWMLRRRRYCAACRMEEDARTGPLCAECGARTNHTTTQHRDAERTLYERCRHCGDCHSPSYEC